MLKLFLVSVVVSASLLAGEISVAVAANLSDAVEVLKTEFAQNKSQYQGQYDPRSQR